MYNRKQTKARHFKLVSLKTTDPNTDRQLFKQEPLHPHYGQKIQCQTASGENQSEAEKTGPGQVTEESQAKVTN